MKILIEGYYYDPDLLERESVSEGLIEYHRNKDGKVCYNYVGHVLNPHLNEYIFFLPKVILEEKHDAEGNVLGDTVFEQFTPEQLISINDNHSPLSQQQRDFVCELAVWVYRSLVVYKKTHPNQQIILDRTIAQVGKQRKRTANNLLDVILELIQFNKDNRDFVTFILKNIHSGYNKIHWTKTISSAPAFLQGGIPLYLDPINRKKQVNFDEELFIIYFSILNYVAERYGFPVYINVGFPLITGRKFERYLHGFGIKRLKQIKSNYFSDKALRLWELCYAFFEKAHPIAVHEAQKEYLLAQNFNIVFEAMIDRLVGSNNLATELKEQEDGKRVDHIYTYDDLIYASEQERQNRQTYYIGDSKYYKRNAVVGKESVYKQFTYARNVIQWNINLFLSDDEEKRQRENPQRVWLRDDVTEGYNIIPNFFISAFVDKELNYKNANLVPKDTSLEARQFNNRLFDRDSLLISHYDVNFLYVLSLYARDNNASIENWKDEVRREFRRSMQEKLNKQYQFYAMTAHADVDAEQYMRENFQQVLGKVYMPYANKAYFALALDNNIKYQEENELLLNMLSQSFHIVPCKIGDDPAAILPQVEHQPKPIVPQQFLPLYWLENYLDKNILIGCYKSEEHLAWIQGKNDRGTLIYNVRLDKNRTGSIKRSEALQKKVSFVILYPSSASNIDPNKIFIYHVHNNATMTEERMRQAMYPNPKGKYFCYVFDEQVALGKLDIYQFISQYLIANRLESNEAPIYTTGEELIKYRK